MPFRRIIRGKSKLTGNYPVESLSTHGKSKSHFLRPISTSTDNLDKNSSMGDQYFPRFGRKNLNKKT
jgi:hypothetical protein